MQVSIQEQTPVSDSLTEEMNVEQKNVTPDAHTLQSTYPIALHNLPSAGMLRLLHSAC